VPYAASGQTRMASSNIKVEGSGKVIRLQGTIIGTVLGVHLQGGGDSRSPGVDLHWINTIRQILSRDASLFASRYPNLQDALARLLTIDDQYMGGNSVAFGWTVAIENPGAELDKAIEALSSRPAPDASGLTANLDTSRSSTDTFILQMGAAITWRGFAMAETGYMALVPIVTKAGDKVVIFEGATVPYILRPNSLGERFLLVGDAKVQGIMYGEALGGRWR
jgi:hypothetical protein